MSRPITDIAQVKPEWLTGILHLEQGCVTALKADTSRPFGSMVSRLRLTYSDDAPAAAPRQLFLKTANPDVHRQWPGRGKREIGFYEAIPAGDYDHLPLPRCYDAAFDHEEGFHLLLDDLSETHIVLPHPFPPSTAQCQQAADALARLHAYWWQDERLGVSMGRSAEQKTIFNSDETLYPDFADFLGENLWPERRRYFERAMQAAPHLHKRLSQGRLTMIHGDSHAWNFLYPRDPNGSAKLVDWETWDADVGVFDLAFLIALFWFPAHRARAEKTLVQYYHARLVEHGVGGYSWDDCWHDYRHSVIRLLFRPVWWWQERRDDLRWAELWWPRLERVICAFEDLHCEELL